MRTLFKASFNLKKKNVEKTNIIQHIKNMNEE